MRFSLSIDTCKNISLRSRIYEAALRPCILIISELAHLRYANSLKSTPAVKVIFGKLIKELPGKNKFATHFVQKCLEMRENEQNKV